MRLIDADALIEKIDKDVFNSTSIKSYVRCMAKKMPAIDAVPVVHGEWITEYDGFDFNVTCSLCGEAALIKEGGSHDHAYSRYCPNCGAIMDGKEKKDGQIK